MKGRKEVKSSELFERCMKERESIYIVGLANHIDSETPCFSKKREDRNLD